MHMKLPLGLGVVDWTDWFKGLISAFISGGASSVAAGMTVSMHDPKDYEFLGWAFWKLVFNVFLVSGFLGMMTFLRRRAAPWDHEKPQVQAATAGD